MLNDGSKFKQAHVLCPPFFSAHRQTCSINGDRFFSLHAFRIDLYTLKLCSLHCMANMVDEAAPCFGEPIAVPTNKPPVLELLPMYAVTAPAKLGGQLMKALGAAAPLGPRLQHVKRVRKLERQGGPPQLEILLCTLDWQDEQQDSDDQRGQGQAATQAAAASPAAGNGAAGGEACAERSLLPSAVDALVRQHNLEPYTVQVRHTWLPVLQPLGCASWADVLRQACFVT